MSSEPDDIQEIEGGFRFDGEAADKLRELAEAMGVTPLEALRAAMRSLRLRLESGREAR